MSNTPTTIYTTPVPDTFFDEMLADLSNAELRVLLYLIRRTSGFSKDTDAVSLNQFHHGIVTSQGKQLDKGCGLKNHSSIINALRSLETRGYIQSKKSKTSKGDNVTTVYHLPFLVINPPKKQQNTRSKESTGEVRPTSYDEYIKSPTWAKKRAKALRFASFKCQVCNSSEELNVHHRTYERLGHEHMGDLTVLCKNCHEIFHNNGELEVAR